MRAKKYHVTEIFPCIIFHNYVLLSAYFRRFHACLFVWWCFSDNISVISCLWRFVFYLDRFPCNTEKRG